MTNVWRIVSKAWYENGGVTIERFSTSCVGDRVYTTRRRELRYITLEHAVRDSRSRGAIIAEEPGAGAINDSWDAIRTPYHVIVMSGVRHGEVTWDELGAYDDLDVAEAAMHIWMIGR